MTRRIRTVATKKRKPQLDPGAPLTPAESRELRAGCDNFVSGHGWVSAREFLAELDVLREDEVAVDVYGSGGTVEILETEVRKLLKKPAAVFMPSGTMIQQSALRIHADRRNVRTVAFHPTCHLELHEDKAYERLHGLVGLTIGDPTQLITVADLEAIREPIAALLIELPQREIGGQLPAWDELVAQTKWAHDRGAGVHMDGARLWECGPFYDRPLSDIAALFDTVYVSFYKGLGGTAGGMLLGETDVIDEAREWRHRHGGTLYNMWPYAASDLAGFRLRLPRMARYAKHARAIAKALSKVEGVELVPDPPQTPMMHIYLRTTAEIFNAAVRRVATQQRLWTWGISRASEIPGYRMVELYAGDASLKLSPSDIAQAVRELTRTP
jgi:threonine aldolase